MVGQAGVQGGYGLLPVTFVDQLHFRHGVCRQAPPLG
jgi:hypothetical protein